MLSKAPYWWAYNAKNKKEMLDKFRNDDESLEGEELLHYSWMQIEEMIESYPYGHMMFVLKTSPTANIDQSPKIFVKWGEIPVVGGYRSKATPGLPAGNNHLLELMMTMQQRNFDQQLLLTKQLVEAQSENRELEAAISGAEEMSFKETIMMRGIDVVEKLMTTPRINAAPQQAVGALGTVGQKDPSTVQEQPAQAKPFSLDLALQHIQVIKAAIPEYSINDIIMVLAIFVQQNTEQARNLIGGLIQQLPGNEG